MKLFKLLTAFVLLGLFSSITMAQTVHQVAEGTDVLKTAIDAAFTGDIIELTTSGGLYLSSDQIVIDKDITIRAHADLATKPILKYVGTATSAYMFKGVGSARLAFEGLEFDGDGTGNGAAAKAKYIARLDNADTTATLGLHMNNCDAHDFNDKFIKPYASCGMDSMVVTNSTFYNGASEGIVLYTGGSSDPAVHLDVAIIENCTFYNIEREAIKGQTYPNTKVMVNHCTFYKIGEVEKKPMVYFRDMIDVVVKNSVFAENNNADNEKFADFASDVSLFHNNTVWGTTNFEVGNATVTDTLHADPLFADAANYDFTLDVNSPAIGYANDGKAAGDLRWDPTVGNPVVYMVEAGTDVLKAAIDAAKAGDIIELATSGGSYLSTDQIVIDKDITIMASSDLAEKPILKYVGTSTSAYMFKLLSSPKIILKDIVFAGDGVADGGAAKAKYAMIMDNDDTSGTMKILIDNCDMSDFTDKIIKPYADCGIDSLLIYNSTFSNSREGVFLFSGTSSDPAVKLKYAEIINCTFYGMQREAIKGQTNPNTKLLVDHCTFYNNGGTAKALIYIADLLEVEIKNSIFSKNGYSSYYMRLANETNLFHNNVLYDVASREILNGTSAIDTLFADPQFLDAANANFTLASSSLARTAAEGGTPAGDLRWAIDPNSKILSVVTEGNGIVKLDPAGGVYLPGTSVTMTAAAALGWEFESWSGFSVFPPNQNPTTIVVNDNMTVTAKFKNLTPQVTLSIDSIGLGSVVTNPSASDEGTFDKGTTVELTAVPATDWEFVEWLGDVTGTTNPITTTLDSNMVVTASFKSTLTQFALTATIIGKGDISIDPMPVIATYDTNTIVHVTAVPAIGWTFNGWSVDLTGTSLTDSVTMDSDKNITATFLENQIAGGVLEIDSTWDLYDAIEYANNNSTVHTLLLTTAGLYTSNTTATVSVWEPLTIKAADGLDSKPILSNSDPDGIAGEIDILRVYNDITLKGVIIDGSTNYSAGMKYGVRYSNGTAPDTVKWGSNATFMDVEFRHLFDDGKETGDGHAFKLDKELILGVVKFEGCTFNDIGYEAIRMSDTEKWTTDRIFDSLIVRNCTFTNIDAEGIRYYSDLEPNTPDAPVIIENVTFDNSSTSTIYLKNSGGAIVRNIIISNPRKSGHGRDGDLMNAQGTNDGTNQISTFVSNIDTFNVGGVTIATVDNEVDEATIYGIDPMYEDAANMNWTLLANSHLYNLGYDGKTIGDLRWATNIPTSVALTITAENGNVLFDPLPIGKTYDPQTVVTVTAVPDSGYLFVNWAGDLTGNVNPSTITMDGNKSVTAVFDVDTDVNDLQIPKEFGLSQNYPNPFNPSTTINFALPAQSVITLRIYDILGQVVTTLYNNKIVEAGYQSVHWNGINLASGLYIYRLDAKGSDGKEFVKSLKMMFLK
ncbi:MAG: DUF5123 domain-containing protein [Bacteroidetes bacterium]|nr:DUF5123 domain-containing protein [Bacteroidota bacterium]MBU1117032.1 DUF5123 domain-containing protein [Bacteroidota bacterium]MBU1797627.1 DUF5123 domain-containing protein [Bacteroidota bacterium]